MSFGYLNLLRNRNPILSVRLCESLNVTAWSRQPSSSRILHTLSSRSNHALHLTNSTQNSVLRGGSQWVLSPKRKLPYGLKYNLGAMQQFSANNRPPQKRGRIGLVGAVGTSAIILASKGKYLLGALKLTKFATLGSMLVTIGTYSMFFGVPYAIGMVSQIVVHESGHALVMKRMGIPFSPMVFIPFVGAAIAMNRSPHSAYDEALIAFGGPVLGSIGAVGFAFAGHFTQSQLCFALADFGFMINLFNLLPIGFMDGGRICGALSPYAGIVGLGMGGALIYNDVVTNPILYLVMLSGAYSTFMRFYSPQDHLPLNYYNITGKQRLGLTAGYFGLISALILAMAMNNRFKKSPRQLEYERVYGVDSPAINYNWDDREF